MFDAFYKPPPKPEAPVLEEPPEPPAPMSKEQKKILSWRIDRLMIDGGYPAGEATALALEGVDYRVANRLLKLSGDLEWALDQLLDDYKS